MFRFMKNLLIAWYAAITNDLLHFVKMNWYFTFCWPDSSALASEESMTTAHVTKIIISMAIFLVGILGNTAVIFVILILREYRKTVTHW